MNTDWVNAVSGLPIFSSTHKPLAYLLDIYYTTQAVFSQAISLQNLRDWLRHCVKPIRRSLS